MFEQKYSMKKHSLGFYQIHPLPSIDQLSQYYRDEYWQGGGGVKSTNDYLPEELMYFKNLAKVSEFILNLKVTNLRGGGSLLDLGCGGGFFAKHFYNNGWKIEAVDFSSFGIERYNPDLIPYFLKNNILTYLEEIFTSKKKYNFINLNGVLEHVLDPSTVIDKIKYFLAPQGILRINVPNDFSDFQNVLVKEKNIKETWFRPIEHINYFNCNSLTNLLLHQNLKIVKMIMDFPIEMFLSNKHSNYWIDPDKGKEAHLSRIFTDNFLFEQGIEKYIAYYEAASDLGFGRTITAFVKI